MRSGQVEEAMSWTVTREKVLTRDEIVTVIADLKRRSKRYINVRLNLILFRLATCCGLRVSELTQLTLDNVRVGSSRPKIVVPDTVGKGGKGRIVPVIDQGTLDDLKAWKELRESQGARPTDLFICSQSKGTRISRHNARRRFISACKALGRERQAEITIHHGRHSFISHALHQGHNIVQVQHMAGHSSLGTTSIYAHLVSDEAQIGNLFG
jgi:integrase/recombinase XerD